MEEAYKVGHVVELITPARFLFNAGSTPKAWNNKMLQDKHFKVVTYEPDSGKVFNNISIPGGVAVTYYDNNASFAPIEVFSQFEVLNTVRQKIMMHPDFSSMEAIVVSRTAYRLTEKMHQDHPEAISQLSKGHAYDMSSNIFERLPQIFFDIIPDKANKYIRMYGKIGTERIYKYIRADYVREVSNLYNYKVVMARADGAAGTVGNPIPARIIGTPHLEEPSTGTTETFLSIGSFDSKNEGENALKYVKTKFHRAMISILKSTQDITPEKWRFVPLQNFTEASDIDWTQSVADIDRQLYRKYGLTQEEIDFIETHVKEME